MQGISVASSHYQNIKMNTVLQHLVLCPDEGQLLTV